MIGDPLVLVLVALGGYFAAATLFQAVSGGDVGRMFGGEPAEVGLQIVGAVMAVLLAGRVLG